MIDLRTEYPRPQAVRADYLCLNGEWEFEIDNALVGVEKKYFERAHLEGKITVPYCPESVLSGVGNTDFMYGVWYRRDLEIPAEYAGRRILLHFGAVDHEAHVYVNGREVGSHMGGYTPFSFDITDALTDGVNSLCVYARDDVRSRNQPAGKQCPRLDSYGCFYTRTTGIWQTVWLEPVSEGYISTFFTDTSISAPSVTLRVRTVNAIGQTLTVSTSYEGKPTGSAEVKVFSPVTTVTVPLSETHLWEIGNGRLYDATLSLSGGDSVAAYFGLREVSWDKKGMYINGKIFFGRYILDQSFFPDGIYTAPSDARLKQDILDSMALGFNGARMHEKVFEPRYLYHADRLGYLVWGEFPNWVLDVTEYTSLDAYIKPWIESMERDYNHPSLIGWCPFNETWDHAGRKQCDAVLAAIY
ncbi:MAG: beta-galactosidase, partial [Clostridia bacterium]|nr:beta-galactosidase [Clostridia bacterium]